MQVLLLKACEDEAVDVVLRPRGVFDGRNRMTRDALVGPGRGVVVFFGGEAAGEQKDQQKDWQKLRTEKMGTEFCCHHSAV
jgi:hypothetical protein